MDSEVPDQTVRMRRLIWFFVIDMFLPGAAHILFTKNIRNVLNIIVIYHAKQVQITRIQIYDCEDIKDDCVLSVVG